MNLIYRIYQRYILFRTRSYYISDSKRAFYFGKLRGFFVGKSRISYGVEIHTNHFSLGDGSFINSHTFINDCNLGSKIIIGNNVFIAPYVHIDGVSHNIGTSAKRAGETFSEDVIIHDGAWICANSVILPGVEIGAGSIVAAGSVVTCNVPANQLWAGVPATFKRTLDN